MSAELSRRALLKALSAAALLPAVARAFGDTSKFVPAVAQHGGRWNGRLSGMRRLAWELQRRTSIEVQIETPSVPLSSPKLFDHPFLYLGGQGDMPPFSGAELENLRRYLTFGGFLLANAEDGSDRSGFDASFRREMARLIPQAPLEALPQEHVIFKSFFLLDSAPGRLFHKPYLEGIQLGNRAAVVYSQNDLAGAWSRDEGGDYEFDVVPGGEPQRELAMRMGINLCMYALCLDYKDDAVHLPLILNKRR